MTCCKVIEVEKTTGAFDHGSELNEGIAPNTGIRCTAIEILAFEVLQDCSLIQILKVYSMMDDSQFPADFLSLLKFFLFPWVIAGVGVWGWFKIVVFPPDKHGDPFHFKPLFLQ